ncbi:MAG: rubrerythrin family protein [Thermoplasmata archaeon]
MSETDENLKAAFAGESQANRRYLAFARKADQEGHPQVARLFRAGAESETFHAMNHLKAMGGIGSTEENLQEAMSGERHEAVKMYPEFIEKAEAEGNQRAITSFKWALEAEKVHEKLYSKVLEALKAGQEPEEVDYNLCSVCGYTVEGEPPERCPICNAPKSKFTRF